MLWIVAHKKRKPNSKYEQLIQGNSFTIIFFQSAFLVLCEVTLYNVADHSSVRRQIKYQERTVLPAFSSFVSTITHSYNWPDGQEFNCFLSLNLDIPPNKSKNTRNTKLVIKCVKHKQNSVHKTVLPISCYTNTHGTINIVNTSATFELHLNGIDEFVDITSNFPIYIQCEFMSEDIAAPAPNVLHLTFADLIY